mgnify:FL=1
MKISYQITYRGRNPHVKDFKKFNQYSKYKLIELQKLDIKEGMDALVEKVKSLNEEQAKKVMLELEKCINCIIESHKYFKDRIKNISLDVLKDILLCSYDTSSVKMYRTSIKANIALLDFMLERLLLKKYISEKNLYKLTNELVEINKMVTGWLNNCESKLI